VQNQFASTSRGSIYHYPQRSQVQRRLTSHHGVDRTLNEAGGCADFRRRLKAGYRNVTAPGESSGIRTVAGRRYWEATVNVGHQAVCRWTRQIP